MQRNNELDTISQGLFHLVPEIVLTFGILLFIFLALFKSNINLLRWGCIAVLVTSAYLISQTGLNSSLVLFNGMLKLDGFSLYMKLLMDIAGILMCMMPLEKEKQHAPEFYAILISAILGGHLLASTTHALVIFLSLELLSISSYVLSGYSFSKRGSEASLKYFLFGSVASAVMLYGFSLLFGVTGTLDFASEEFYKQIIQKDSPLILMASFMVLAGFLYKISAAPMHPWAPDVYEGAPIPVIAFLSVAPKFAGITVLTKFIIASSIFGQSLYNWQQIIAVIALVTIGVGNFSALRQQNAKRLMAYSSIAQSGFMLVGIAAFSSEGLQTLLFYASVYMIMNFLVFLYLQFFEKHGYENISAFSGAGKRLLWPSIFLLIGLIALTGLPPTGGFTAKLLIFSTLWQSYEESKNAILIGLLIFGLVNTVISLFYYLRIPYYAFLKTGQPAEKPNLITSENLFGLILVLVLLILFFAPAVLMSWINKINFVL
jgi:NADH-quinone oxidoreductase subunit N